MSYLILVRHGKSEWNALGLWTGWRDIPLNVEGVNEAKKAGLSIEDIKIDKAYTSKLLRAKQTLEEILKVLNIAVPIVETEALNERDYGNYTGKNKWEIKKQVGEEEFQKIRRSWDHPIPNGESLKMVYERVIPFYQTTILPELRDGKNILITAHGNSLRALVKELEKVSDEKIPELEIGTGETYIYEFNSSGQIVSKQIRSANPNTGKI